MLSEWDLSHLMLVWAPFPTQGKFEFQAAPVVRGLYLPLPTQASKYSQVQDMRTHQKISIEKTPKPQENDPRGR